MDHSMHAMMGAAAAAPRCAMNMLWNTQIEDTCIVFRSWHVSSTASFVASCLAVVALGVLYEWLRVAQRALDRRIAVRLVEQGKGKRTVRSGRNSPDVDSEGAALLTGLPALKVRAG